MRINSTSRNLIRNKKKIGCKHLVHLSLTCPVITAGFRGSFVWRQQAHCSACYIQKLDDETLAKITLIMITRKPHCQRTVDLKRNRDGSKHLKGQIFTRLDLIMMSLHRQERQIAGEHLPPFQTEKIPELSVSS
jgi:hypothetical protein